MPMSDVPSYLDHRSLMSDHTDRLLLHEECIQKYHLQAKQWLILGLEMSARKETAQQIVTKLNLMMQQCKVSDPQSLLFYTLYKLRLYHAACEIVTSEEMQNSPLACCYAKSLIHNGQVDTAISFITLCLEQQNSVVNINAERLRYLSLLCKLKQNKNTAPLEWPANQMSQTELLSLAVSVGMIEEAMLMVSLDEPILYCHLINTLYAQGHISAAERLLSTIPDPLSLGSQSIYGQTAFIAAEIKYDQGDYDGALLLFEALISNYPEMSIARFGAASCCLHRTLLNLYRRIELYHPSQEELSTIVKYTKQIQRALEVLGKAGWHTNWSPGPVVVSVTVQ